MKLRVLSYAVQTAIFYTFSVSTAFASTESLCEGLVNYAKATVPGNSLQVKLSTDWSNFKKSCVHNGKPESAEFCRLLIPNSSTEFMKDNLASLLKCAGADFKFGNTLLNELEGSLIVFKVPNADPNVELKFSFSIGNETAEDYVEITSRYEKLD